MLLLVIGLDTFRNIAENVYFGFYFGGRYGLFPSWVTDTLGQPELIILPKIANVIAGCVVLMLLLFHWLPQAVKEWKALEQRAEDLQTLAAIDPLTGIFNRRQFETLARSELVRTQRYVRPLSVLIVDIDFFKRVNDTFGHHVGDLVLKMVATSLKSAKRDPDLVARIGGEEFAILLPESNLEAAGVGAERLRSMIHANSLAIGEERLNLTISIGVAEASLTTPSIDAILRDADQALYRAKANGRNQVCLAKPPSRITAAAAE
ncbi:GGDEF domain-containing protein [Bradyrhizobium japonicum]|uniref:GGDEF domain-containing protein n=1 Tax=Bradyrhizobium japonicum TaxID=375 RepID=UPI003B680FEC